jgi:hypothetical protein
VGVPKLRADAGRAATGVGPDAFYGGATDPTYGPGSALGAAGGDPDWDPAPARRGAAAPARQTRARARDCASAAAAQARPARSDSAARPPGPVQHCGTFTAGSWRAASGDRLHPVQRSASRHHSVHRVQAEHGPIELSSGDEEGEPGGAAAAAAAAARHSERLSARAGMSTAERFKARCPPRSVSVPTGSGTVVLGRAAPERAATARTDEPRAHGRWGRPDLRMRGNASDTYAQCQRAGPGRA